MSRPDDPPEDLTGFPLLRASLESMGFEKITVLLQEAPGNPDFRKVLIWAFWGGRLRYMEYTREYVVPLDEPELKFVEFYLKSGRFD
jgi:hypothetical protein